MYSSAIAPSRHLATVTMRSPFSNSPMTLRLKERQGQGIGQSAPDRDPALARCASPSPCVLLVGVAPIGPRPRLDALDHLGLGLRVGVHVRPVPLQEVALDALVEVTVLCIGAQLVS